MPIILLYFQLNITFFDWYFADLIPHMKLSKAILKWAPQDFFVDLNGIKKETFDLFSLIIFNNGTCSLPLWFAKEPKLTNWCIYKSLNWDLLSKSNICSCKIKIIYIGEIWKFIIFLIQIISLMTSLFSYFLESLNILILKLLLHLNAQNEIRINEELSILCFARLETSFSTLWSFISKLILIDANIQKKTRKTITHKYFDTIDFVDVHVTP